MKSKKKNILFVGPFPNPITGNSISNLSAYEGFKERGYKVDLINSSLPFFDEKIGVFSLRKFFNSIKINGQVFKILRADLIYLTPGQTFFGVLKYMLIVFSAKMFQKKIIIHIHGNYLRKTLKNAKGLKRTIIKKILSSANKGIVLSKSLLPNLLPVLDRKNIYVVNNFVEDFLLENTEELVLKKSFEEIRIIFLSNLMKEKGIIDLLEALKILNRKKVKFRAKIAGNIDLQLVKKIEELFRDLDNVEYLGVVKSYKKKQMLLWGNVFVFPTYYQMEGQPISILEAMATGNLVLTTNHAGIPDIFSEENGFFIKKKNCEDIVDKINLIMTSKKRCKNIIFKNYRYVSSNYTRKMYISNLEKVFNL